MQSSTLKLKNLLPECESFPFQSTSALTFTFNFHIQFKSAKHSIWWVYTLLHTLRFKFFCQTLGRQINYIGFLWSSLRLVCGRQQDNRAGSPAERTMTTSDNSNELRQAASSFKVATP